MARAKPIVTKTGSTASVGSLKNKSKRVIRLGDVVLVPNEVVEVDDEELLDIADSMETIVVKRTKSGSAE